MRQGPLERLRAAKKEKMPVQELTLEQLMLLLLNPVQMDASKRHINPTQLEFINSADFCTAFMGPAGSAKTSAGCCAGMLRALLQPGSKGLVGRHDYNKLKDSTMLRMREMLEALPPGVLLDRDKTPPEKWWIQSIPRRLEDGRIEDTPSQITFMGMNDSLGSLEFDWIFLDEADLIPMGKIHEAKSRLRHVAPIFKKTNRQPPYRLMLAFNPPPKSHELYTAVTGLDFKGKKIAEPWLKLYRPKLGENTHNLPTGYYERLAATLPEDQRVRLVEGDWGSTFSGQPVYREFKRLLHVVPGLKDQWTTSSQLYRFWDFGYRHPACLWAFIDWEGRLKVVHEELGENKEASAWADYCKQVTATLFNGAHGILDFGDPAIVQTKDTGQTLAVFRRAGINMRYMTKKVKVGINTVRRLLGRLVSGEPAIQFDPSCHITISALMGGYSLDSTGEDPVKDDYHDHLCDALRYGVTNLFPQDEESQPRMPTLSDPWSQWIPNNLVER